MSFLAPLFMLGALAVAAPIIFHLIRRTSREKVRFSSLMFLQQTPPRMTRQSRLQNIFLLILRCLVLALLALGFARPFFQKPMAADAGAGAGRRMVVLVDASASMRQEDLWREARERADAVLRSARPADSIALMVFDRSARSLMGFEQWAAAGSAERAVLASKRLEETSPGWSSTHLGNALLTAVETLEDNAGRDVRNTAAGEKKIVVITDLQDGSRLDGLQGFEWPRGVTIDIQIVKPRRVTNAGLHLVPEADERERNLTDTGVKVRVNNAANSAREQFQVGWTKPGGNDWVGTPASIYVPPGQSRVVAIEGVRPESGVTQPETLRLTGDDNEFDNVAFHVPPKAEQIRVLFVGPSAEGDAAKSLYYLRRAFLETRRQKVEVLARPGNSPFFPAESDPALLMIVAGGQPPEATRAAREFLQSGRTVLFALTETGAGGTLAELLGLGALDIREAAADRYALLGQIDFQHPIFAPFADPRFSDFTKIHFWKHRVVDSAAIRNARVLARFDDSAPALMEIPSGRGTLFVLTSGWQPADSQLALSSKFVPMLYSLLELSGATGARLAQYSVGDTLALSSTNAAQAMTVRKPDGQQVTAAAGERFSGTDLPGVYAATVGQSSFGFAVNLDPAESRTAPLSVDDLERLGVPVKPPSLVDQRKEAEAKERLHAAELEQRQKLWRWLLIAALLVLLLETTVAGWLTRRQAAIPA